MKRTMFQLYLKHCDEAIEFYKKAFGATVDAIHRDSDNKHIMYAEIRAFGQCIAFSERDATSSAGNTMQFCFHFGDGNDEVVKNVYAVLKEDAQVEFPIGPCDWSPCLFGLIDKFGVNWCLFV